MTGLFADYERHLITVPMQDTGARAEYLFLKLVPEHFQETTCRTMLGAALALYLDGKPVDVLSAAKNGKITDYHGFLDYIFPHAISIPEAIKTLRIGTADSGLSIA